MNTIRPFSRVVSRCGRRACLDPSSALAGDPGRGMASLTMDNLNPCIVKLQYAVRGPLVTRAGEIEKELAKGVKKPFKKVIRANIGDAHAMGQQPITFFRQVLALAADPALAERADYPEDVRARAKLLLDACGGRSVGSYSASHGLEVIRRQVAAYIAARDGHPARWEDVFLTAGASVGIKNVLQLFSNQPSGRPSGVMIPIPQYPLYSATLAEYDLEQVPYYLDEANQWGLDAGELKRALAAGRERCDVRALVVINPGNPTGQVLTRANIEQILKFARDENLFVLADEVYQANVYDPKSEFHSFKKVLRELGGAVSAQQELASFMSVSKGYAGECGLRGGWAELVNVQPAVQAELYKAVSANLCPTVLGQVLVSCVAAPPAAGQPSHELFERERRGVLQSLAARAALAAAAFNDMPGFQCNVVQGAMYAFPSFKLSEKALAAAAAAKQAPDVFYAFKLLEETGICIVAGSGFGQRPGTYHFRTTILPQPPLLKEMLDIFKDFHRRFTDQYK